MTQEIDAFAYMMAAEKMGNLIFTIEQTMAFMDEYKIKPDLEVKNALTPRIDEIRNWLKDES